MVKPSKSYEQQDDSARRHPVVTRSRPVFLADVVLVEKLLEVDPVDESGKVQQPAEA